MVREHRSQRQAQAGQVGGFRPLVQRQRQQRTPGRGRAALALPAIGEQAPRAVLGIEPVARGRIDRIAVAIAMQLEAHAERIEQVALEAAQRPCQRLAAAQALAGARVGGAQARQRVLPRRQAQHQLVEVEGGQQRVAGQHRCGIERFGRAQLRQFAGEHRVEADVLQRLQRRAQHLPLRRMHATRDQADAAVAVAQHFHQQAGLAPRPRVQDEAGFAFDPHPGSGRRAAPQLSP